MTEIKPFKPCVIENHEIGLTEYVHEDVAYTAYPVGERKGHYVDACLAHDDGRLVGVNFWWCMPKADQPEGEGELIDKIDGLAKGLKPFLTSHAAQDGIDHILDAAHRLQAENEELRQRETDTAMQRDNQMYQREEYQAAFDRAKTENESLEQSVQSFFDENAELVGFNAELNQQLAELKAENDELRTRLDEMVEVIYDITPPVE